MQKEITDAVGLVPVLPGQETVCMCMCLCVCVCVCAVVYIVALMPILLRSLAGAAGQDPDKRVLWCLCRLPVQNTVVLQRPMERRDGSALNGLWGKRMAFIKLLRALFHKFLEKKRFDPSILLKLTSTIMNYSPKA